MDSPLLLVHICGGILGVLSGFTALLARKGSTLHRRSGDLFVVSMLLMAAGGGAVAVIKAQRANILAAFFTAYLVTTAWLATGRRSTRAVHGFVLLLIALAVGVTAFLFGMQGGREQPLFFGFSAIALLSASGDIRVLASRSTTRAQRLVRHLWRMCFALFVATGSFFLGMASDPVLRRSGLRARLFTPEVRQTHLPELPVLAVVVLMIFWLIRVRFTSAYRTTARLETRPEGAPIR